MTYSCKPLINQSGFGLLLYESVMAWDVPEKRRVVSVWNAMHFSNNIWDGILSGNCEPRKNKG